MSELPPGVESLLSEIWKMPLSIDLLSKKIDVSIYSDLSRGIPDNFVVIEEVFPKEELSEIWNNFNSYLNEYRIFPFLGTLGEAVICIGYGEENLGKIFYFDFDFGCFELDSDDLNTFIKKLVDK